MRRGTINRRCGVLEKTIARERSPEHLLFWRRTRSMSINLRTSGLKRHFQNCCRHDFRLRNVRNLHARVDAFDVSPFCSGTRVFGQSLNGAEESPVVLFPDMMYDVIRNSLCSINHLSRSNQKYFITANVLREKTVHFVRTVNFFYNSAVPHRNLYCNHLLIFKLSIPS